MSDGTKIEWADATFNPWWGCEKVSPGCAHCYAEKTSNHRAGKGLWGSGHGYRFFADRHWDEPHRWARNLPAKLGRRPRVFCASMADVFEERPELVAPRFRLLSLILDTPELDWLVLTKRPAYAREWLGTAFRYSRPFDEPLPANLWMGASIENARYTWRADVLREIPAAVRFISAEPLLGSLINPRPNQTIGDLHFMGPRRPLDLADIDWVIVGGESGPRSRSMALPWARELVDECRRSGVAPFVKQLGAMPVDVHLGRNAPYEIDPLKLRDKKGGDWDEWPADLRIREFPRSAVGTPS